MTADAILKELEGMGSPSIKKMLMNNHGVKEPCFGVKVGDMKKLVKPNKGDHELALALYDTGNYDAMYLAGLIADDDRMTKRDLQRWVGKANGGALAGSTVPWVAAGSKHGWDIALKWIESKKPVEASAGWATLSCLVALKEDEDFDLSVLKQLLTRVGKTIHEAPDAVRYAMNNYIISVGGYVTSLTAQAKKTGEKVGKVVADLGNNACKIPYAPDYIEKMEARGNIGKKRRTVKC